MKRFVLIGAAGYVAPRHMRAIKETGHELIAAYDPSDSVGILDRYFPNADFFTEFERFDRHLEKLKRLGHPIDYVSICSPNYLHDAHIRFGLRIGAHVICEKPTVLNPWNVDALKEIEKEYPGKVNNILQLRLHPSVQRLKQVVDQNDGTRYKVDLKYVTARGKWYKYSWKGDISKSGGVVANIGIHFFDMLLWIFGNVVKSDVTSIQEDKSAGRLSLDRADVQWSLSTDFNDLPEKVKVSGQRTFRRIEINGEHFDMSGGFENLHTISYQKIIDKKGYALVDVEKCIDLIYQIRKANL